MSARPPPARPHIGLNPSNRFGGYSSSDWAEDDAWDSGSDEEASGSGWRTTHSRSTSSTAPKPVPKPQQNSSSSTLASSYTHVNAPSPSSYPPRPEQPPTKQGWTIITNAREDGRDEGKQIEAAQYIDHDGDLIVGDLDPDEPVVKGHNNTQVAKPGRRQCVVREDVDDIVQDPLHVIRRIPSESDPQNDGLEVSEKVLRERSIRLNRRQRFLECITNEDVSMAQLRKLSWNGVPDDLRSVAWPLLLGYLPLPAHLRISTLARKRSEYLSLVELAFARNRDALDQQIWHQIEIDVPRTRPGVPLWMHASTQKSLERILYVWAIRHPASGYVQGINDLVTPFYQVFLSAFIDSDPEEFNPALLPTEVLNAVEADSFWCLSRLLDGIQDNYIAGQPGIHRSVKRMTELVARIDPSLSAHLEAENVEFMQFAFRWMNCLLMREISVKNTIRMWDTYLAEGPDAFSQFHLYVCSAFLVQWSKKLKEMDFQGIIMFLQSLPTQNWTDYEIELLLSEAFVHYSTWHNAQSHFGK
ncbi:rab-GTPase-TBC domain-containing protein [Irpex rosettiformis]|uniref:Rab-GTPase-TBC domain-containing protein n=1 Tax=Irpex rosettiformis TaxID=378272 RepID=A0ACB8UFT0_9APHY|nr:rab-GTPase-TBC domain-containing protein [Irpex rosettiformis]